jgi:hypothetical protein
MPRMAILSRLSFQLNPMREKVLCGINPDFSGLSPRKGQVPYALRTRAPVAICIAAMLPLDLHVLSLPLAFILSQDQTLRCLKLLMCFSVSAAALFLIPVPYMSMSFCNPEDKTPALIAVANLLTFYLRATYRGFIFSLSGHYFLIRTKEPCL